VANRIWHFELQPRSRIRSLRLGWIGRGDIAEWDGGGGDGGVGEGVGEDGSGGNDGGDG
jgi:hypothetical protein